MSSLGVAAVLLLAAQALAQDAVGSKIGFKGCDVLRDAGLDDILTLPGDAAYGSSVSTYYSSENRRLRPFCIVQPRSTEQVSSTVKALAGVSGTGSWDIAVRSGGHSDWDNNAVRRGVTIDLSFFNSTNLIQRGVHNWTGQTELTDSVFQIRPAARWGPVLAALEPLGLGVTGGRAGSVGVGGLLVSGGASYYTQKWGLSCNNVVGYEVVLADGSIVEASAQENSDLFRALKGGGGNLGIVTRFDLRTFTVPPNGAFGGLAFASWDSLDAANEQFVSYANSSSGSPDHEFMLYRADGPGRPLALMFMAVSTDGRQNSTNFAPLGSSIPLTIDRRAQQPLSRIASSIADVGGSHYISWCLTVQAVPAIMQKASELFVQLASTLQDPGTPVGINWVFQPISKPSPDDQPNILGLDESLPADSILFEARATLAAADVAAHEGFVQTAMAASVEELRSFSASLEGHSPYAYMNYANPEQDVLGSYGADNVEFLRSTAAKYDPTGFFQGRVPGGWKVSRVE